MNLDYTAVVIAILAAILSGMGTAIIAGLRDNRKEKIRRAERDQDHLKLEVKDLKFYTDSNLQESRDRNGVLNYLKCKNKLIEIQECKVINLKNNTLCSIRDLL